MLEEHFHINIISRERNQQLVIQCLDLIAIVSDLQGEILFYFNHLYLNLTP